MQFIIIFIVLACAIGYAAWRIYKALSAPPNPCAGCQGCALKDRRKCPNC